MIDEKKLDQLAVEFSGYNFAHGVDLGLPGRRGFIYGYKEAFADQQKKIEKLEKALQIVEEWAHGGNIDHYGLLSEKINSILKGDE